MRQAPRRPTTAPAVPLAVILAVALIQASCAGRPRAASSPTFRSSAAAAPPPTTAPTLDITTTKPGTVQASAQGPALAVTVDFVDARHGWAIGNCDTAPGGDGCAILATRDGGATWTTQRTGLAANGSETVLQFVNAEDGFVVDTAALCTRDCATDILATTDGGATWHLRLSVPAGPAAPPVSAVDFVTATTGWAVRPSGLARTTAGGTTWSTVPAPKNCTFQSLQFTTPADGWAGGSGPAGPCVDATHDGGARWDPLVDGVQAPSPIAPAFTAYWQALWAKVIRDPARLAAICGVSQVHFQDAAAWLVLSCTPADPGAFAVLRSTDGGTTWSYVWGSFGCLMGCAGDGESLAPLAFRGDAAWRAVPFGVARTVDGGKTWTTGTRLCAIGQCVPSVSFVSATAGWAATANGIFATHDAGETWQRQVPARGPGPLRAVHFVSPTTGYALPQLHRDTLVATADGGSTWHAVSPVGGLPPNAAGSPAPSAQGLWFLPGGATGWVWNDQALAVTADGGATWRALPPPPASGPIPVQIQQVDFVSPEDGWLVDPFGDLFRTTDGGQTWTPLALPAPGAVHAVAFLDATHGFATTFSRGAGHFALVETGDGGATWTAVATWPWPPQRGQFNTTTFSFASPQSGWLFAFGGLLRTADGGRTWSEFAQPGLLGLFPQSLQFVNAADGWLLTNAGALLRSTDGGQTWTELPIGA